MDNALRAALTRWPSSRLALACGRPSAWLAIASVG
jgi:hypothetical protein